MTSRPGASSLTEAHSPGETHTPFPSRGMAFPILSPLDPARTRQGRALALGNVYKGHGPGTIDRLLGRVQKKMEDLPCHIPTGSCREVGRQLGGPQDAGSLWRGLGTRRGSREAETSMLEGRESLAPTTTVGRKHRRRPASHHRPTTSVPISPCNHATCPALRKSHKTGHKANKNSLKRPSTQQTQLRIFRLGV